MRFSAFWIACLLSACGHPRQQDLARHDLTNQALASNRVPSQGRDPAPTSSPQAPSVEVGSIEGVVTNPLGQSVEGALVAAVAVSRAERMDWPRRMAKSDKQGRFRIATLPPSRYALTATHPNHCGAFLSGVALEPGSHVRGVQLELESSGATISGAVRTRDDNGVTGGTIRAQRGASYAGDVFVAEFTGAKYQITLPRGLYFFTVTSSDNILEDQAVNANRSRSVNFELEPIAQQQLVAPPAVVDWIRTRAIPLPLNDASPITDEVLKHVTEDTKIVMFGEETHGTHDFASARQQMLELLVTKRGFNILGIEANYSDSLALNDYVLDGRGDPATALSRLQFWMVDTEEMLDLLQWIRHHNLQRDSKHKVRFLGFDIQAPQSAANSLKQYLERVDPGFAVKARETLFFFKNKFAFDNLFALSEQRRRLIAAGIADIEKHLITHRRRYVQVRGQAAWERGLHDLQLCKWDHQVSIASDIALRDQAMAENIKWIMDHEGVEAKMIAWAHNSHIATHGDTSQEAAPMGAYLREAYGIELVAIAMVTARGLFLARDSLGNGVLREFKVPEMPEASVVGALLAAAASPLLIDLREMPNGTVAEWFGFHRPWFVVVGNSYNNKIGASQTVSISASESYDMIGFVEETSPLRVRPEWRYSRPVSQIPAPDNLKFTRVSAEGVPIGWNLTPTLRKPECTVSAGTDQEQSGKVTLYCPRQRLTVPYLTLIEQVSPGDFKGKKVRFSARVKSSVSEWGDAAHLELRVDRAGGKPGFFDGMFESPITSSEWSNYEITGAVAADATSIRFGIVLVGGGTVSLDSVRFEVVKEGA